MTTTLNADPQELAKFSDLAHRWWDTQSEFRPLHEINPLRLGWIEQHTGLAAKRVVDIGCGGGGGPPTSPPSTQPHAARGGGPAPRAGPPTPRGKRKTPPPPAAIGCRATPTSTTWSPAASPHECPSDPRRAVRPGRHLDR